MFDAIVIKDPYSEANLVDLEFLGNMIEQEPCALSRLIHMVISTAGFGC